MQKRKPDYEIPMQQLPFTCRYCKDPFLSPLQLEIHERSCPLPMLLLNNQRLLTASSYPNSSDPMALMHRFSVPMQPSASATFESSPSYASSHRDYMISMANYTAPSSILTEILNSRLHESYNTRYDYSHWNRLPSTADITRQRSYYGSTVLPHLLYHEPLMSTHNGQPFSNFQQCDRQPNQHTTASMTKMNRFFVESYAIPRNVSVDGYPHTLLQPMALSAEHQLNHGVGGKTMGTETTTSTTCKRKETEDSKKKTTPSKFARSAAHDKNVSKSPPRTKNTTRPAHNKIHLEVQQDNAIASDMLQAPIKLYHELDEKNLTQLQCFIRQICIEIVTVATDDVQDYLTGKGNTICVGQVGIRCSFCRLARTTSKIRGSIYFPRSIDLIYGAAMNLIQRHFFTCPCIPASVREQYCQLKQVDARSGASRVYWTQNAANLGLFDTTEGIKYCAAKAVTAQASVSCSEGYSSEDPSRKTAVSLHRHHLKSVESDLSSWNERALGTNHHGNEQKENSCQGGSERNEAVGDRFTLQNNHQASEIEHICWPEDQTSTTRFTYFLMRQMTICTFTEGDRLGKRKELPLGFGGIACRHCISDFGTGRFFPSSVKTMSDTTKTLNILHAHLLKCRKCPTAVKDAVNDLRNSHDKERAALRFGSQKAFFSKIWSRLHSSSS